MASGVGRRAVDAVLVSARGDGVTGLRLAAMIGLPIAIPFAYAVALVAPPSRDRAIRMLEENQPVELVTVAALFAAAVVGALVARAARRAEQPSSVVTFHALFATALFVVAMEEISWGQWFLGFETPETIREVNGQGELNLHNLGGLQDRTEIFRLAFGVGGLAGIWLHGRPFFRPITPSLTLLPWFLAITGLAIPDTINDLIGGGGAVGALFDHLSELTEMLIGLAALLFVVLVRRSWIPRSPSDEVPPGADGDPVSTQRRWPTWSSRNRPAVASHSR